MRTRTHSVVPGVIPLMAALPLVNVPACDQFPSTFGSAVQICTSFTLRWRTGLYRATTEPLKSPCRSRKSVGAAGGPPAGVRAVS